MSQEGLFSLKDKVAVVTGGYGHLGRGICKGLADAGATVIAAGRNRDKFKEVFESRDGSKIVFEQMDVSSEESIKAAFDNISKKTKRIDVLVNCAFYQGGSGDPAEMSSSDFERGIDGTLNSVFRCIKLIVPYMSKAKNGSIINISSMYGIFSPDFSIYKGYEKQFSQPNYGAAKAGVIQLTRYYAAYLAGYGIRVNCISPGAFPTDETVKQKEFLQRLLAKIPMGRIGRPEDLEGAAVFLASDASSYITGQNIIIDGGWTIW
ncbi:MAG: SDR family oxidoreductase [Sedimentisphaerales bacterium]|nr:SDR family oxidoreductase [Sedimentisphaerales bacterium]